MLSGIQPAAVAFQRLFWASALGPNPRTALCLSSIGVDVLQPTLLFSCSPPPHTSPFLRELHHKQMHGRIRQRLGTAAGALELVQKAIWTEDTTAAGWGWAVPQPSSGRGSSSSEPGTAFKLFISWIKGKCKSMYGRNNPQHIDFGQGGLTCTDTSLLRVLPSAAPQQEQPL